MNFFKQGACALLLSLCAGGSVQAQWTTRYKAAPTSPITVLTAVKFINAATGFACGSNNLLLQTGDGGTSWQQVAGVPNHTRSLDALSSNHIFVARQGLFVTQNGGGSWTEWGNWGSSGAYTIHSVKALNDSTALITKGGYILKTTNKGGTWTTVHYDRDLYGGMQFTGNNDTAYAVSGTTHDGLSYGSIHKSTDGGNTWADLNLNGPQLTAWYFRTSREGYYTAFEGGLFKTTDGGSTWQALTNPVAPGSDYVTSLLFSSSTIGYMTTQKGLIYKTQDGGTTWGVSYNSTSNGNVPQTSLTALVMAGNKTIAVGSESDFAETKGLILQESVPAGIPQVEESVVHIYPNPVREKLTVEWEAKALFGRLLLSDVLGKVVFKKDIADQQHAVLEMGALSPGCYFLELQGGAVPYRRQIVVR